MITYKKIADFLLDHLCEVYGVEETITLLINKGYTRKDLAHLNFDKDDIERAFEMNRAI